MLDDAIDSLRQIAGVAGPDTLLVFAPVSLLVGLFLLGIAGHSQRRRWTAWFGWMVVIASGGLLIYALLGATQLPS